jgi:transposase
MLPYSKEMRREVLAACDRGEGTRAVALSFNCSESWVRRVKQERRELGKIAPLLTRRRMPKWETHREQIVELIAQHPDMTLQELKDELKTPLSRQTLCTALGKLKLALKKKS